MRHPECDLRARLAAEPALAGSYARARILASYDEVAAWTAPCRELRTGSALDAGCGAGFDTFALAAEFDRVLGCDIGARPIRAARRTARRAGVASVEFHRTDLEASPPEDRFDFVLANGMSHYGRSRVRLLSGIAAAVGPGGHLAYAEVAESYALRDLRSAIERRDARQARARIRQGLAGLLGLPGFRWFQSGSAAQLLAAFGLEQLASLPEAWNGLLVLDRVIMWRPEDASEQGGGIGRGGAGSGGDANDLARADPDYLELPEPLARARASAVELLASRAERGWSELVLQRAEGSGELDWMLAFLALAGPAGIDPTGASLDPGPAVRLRERFAPRPLDWPALEAIDARIAIPGGV